MQVHMFDIERHVFRKKKVITKANGAKKKKFFTP